MWGVIFLFLSEAYLEGMKTTVYLIVYFLGNESEAYLEGMKTYPVHSTPPICTWSEAYLEGMKTFLI